MPQRKPNQLARVAAVIALAAALVLVVVTIAGSEGNGGGATTTEETGFGQATTQTTRRGKLAVQRGFIVVKEGDTLAQIAAETGLALDDLVELNPQLDPQALTLGDRVRLGSGR